MNVYRAEFFARCPVNGARIRYALRIEARTTVMVEHINAALFEVGEGLHEDIADRLSARLGGRQILTAEHHGVTIETERP